MRIENWNRKILESGSDITRICPFCEWYGKSEDAPNEICPICKTPVKKLYERMDFW